MTAEKPLPCPWCRKTPTVRNDPQTPLLLRPVVSCTTPSCPVQPGTRGAETSETLAIRRWNTRAGSTR